MKGAKKKQNPWVTAETTTNLTRFTPWSSGIKICFRHKNAWWNSFSTFWVCRNINLQVVMYRFLVLELIAWHIVQAQQLGEGNGWSTFYKQSTIYLHPWHMSWSYFFLHNAWGRTNNKAWTKYKKVPDTVKSGPKTVYNWYNKIRNTLGISSYFESELSLRLFSVVMTALRSSM
jgi:hypothetical protein